MGALRAAISLFTLLRVDVTADDIDSLSRSFHCVVIAGALFGLVSASLLYAGAWAASPLLGATLAFFGVQLFNRFFHLDGLMDLGDALVATGDHERRRAIMKDTHVGAGALSFVVLFSLLSVSALASLPMWAMVAIAFGTECLTRVSMVMCASMGRPSGNGLGSSIVVSADAMTTTRALALAVVPIAAVSVAWVLMTGVSAITAALIWVVCAVVAVTVGAVVSHVAMRNIGCVNGDVLGASNEIARPFIVIAASVVISSSQWMPW